MHGELCSRYNIRSYPTVIVYNMSKPHLYRGPHTAAGLLGFIEDTLQPAGQSAVLSLSQSQSHRLSHRQSQRSVSLPQSLEISGAVVGTRIERIAATLSLF